jgi:hypothetical protein
LIPGLGQLYNGERSQGWATLLMSAGLVSGILWATVGPVGSRSWASAIMLGLVYIFILVPAVFSAYAQSGAGRSLLSGDKVWYVIVMLVTVGPLGLPLLWQSSRFSLTAKVVWTVVVTLVALVAILFVIVAGHLVEQQLTTYFLQIAAGA